VEDEAYFSTVAKKIKRQVSVPIILVGGMRSLKGANGILESGAADLVSMSRPLIREPNLVKRWKNEDGKRAKCVSCNQCFGAAMSPEGVYCVLDRKIKARKK
jgi:2,4-dienoyl-CoA reductase-like NADH-dependent reductase (Old Yellow Enzyme family)